MLIIKQKYIRIDLPVKTNFNLFFLFQLIIICKIRDHNRRSAVSINSRWEARDQALSEKLNVLQKQIDTTAGTGKSYTVPTDGSAMTPAQLYAACVDNVVAITGT